MGSDRPPNVLIVVMDSVRAQNTSLHGYERDTTPFLKEFAAGADMYKKARSPGVWSLPSHVSMFTGVHVDQHRINGINDRLAPGHTIFEELSGRGYSTAVFSENTWLTEVDTGIPDTFEEVFSSLRTVYPEALDTYNENFDSILSFLSTVVERENAMKSTINGIESKIKWDFPRLHSLITREKTDAQTYINALLDWSAEKNRWAACVNLMDAHSPFVPADEYDNWGSQTARDSQDRIDDGVWQFVCGRLDWDHKERLVSLYDGSIRQVDAALRELVMALQQRGELKNTLVVMTADHGEAFGERMPVGPDIRLAGHELGLHDVQTHVPLVVHNPEQSSAREFTRPATLTMLPDVIRGTLHGESPSFVPDGPAIASSHGPNDELRLNRAKRYCGDAERYVADIRGVYPSDSGTVAFLRWGTDEKTVYENGTTERPDESRVMEVFDSIPDTTIKEKGSGMSGIDESTRERLDRLGYI